MPTIRVRLTELHCNKANESGWFSSDEPYIICATIAPGGALGKRLLFAVTETFGDVDRGDDRHPNLDLLDEDVETSFAVVAQVVEHDDSEKSLVYGMATNFATVSFSNALMNNLNAPLRELRTVVSDALHSGVVASALPLVDDDDAIGNPAVFSCSTDRINGLDVGEAHEYERDVSGNSARYSLTFEVQRTA